MVCMVWKHHIVEMRGGVTDAGRTIKQRTVKTELLSQWKLEAEFRNDTFAKGMSV